MKWTNRFSSKRVAYSIIIGFLFIIANTIMCSLASVLIDKYICIVAINICFFCLFILLTIRRRLEVKLPEYNYISYGKIALVIVLEWLFVILTSLLVPDFFAPVIVIPIVASCVFDDSLTNALSIYLIVITSLCWNYSVNLVLCYIILVLFGCLLTNFIKKGEALERLYSFVLVFAITTLISIVFYYFNYVELNLSILVYGLIDGISACGICVLTVPFLNRYVAKAQVENYENFLDPDYGLYQEIKKFSQIEYMHASRLARLSRKCAQAINGNVGLAECAGYYYRLGKIEGEPMIDNAIKIANNHCFPVDVIQILSEYGGIVSLPSNKESAIVHMVDSVVTKVELFDHDSMTSTWNQNMVIYQTINELSQKGFYDNSGLTMNQFLIIRDILAKEDILA